MYVTMLYIIANTHCTGSVHHNTSRVLNYLLLNNTRPPDGSLLRFNRHEIDMWLVVIILLVALDRPPPLPPCRVLF